MKKRNIFITVFLCSFIFIFIFTSFSKLILFNKKRRAIQLIEATIQERYGYKAKNFSLLIKDLSFPNAQLLLQSEKEFPAASLVKLPILIVALKAIKENEIGFDDVIIVKKSDITSGSGIIKGMRLPTKLTFMKLLELMIARSDNSATNKLIEILGFDYINE